MSGASTRGAGAVRDANATDAHAVVALALGDAGEHALRLRVAEREENELLASVDPGDGPRRPTTKPSAAGIEQDRARQGDLPAETRDRLVCHSRDYATAADRSSPHQRQPPQRRASETRPW